MEEIKIFKKFNLGKLYRFPSRYEGKEVLVAYDVSDETINGWKKDGKIKGLKILLKYLEERFKGIDKFNLIFVEGDDKLPFEIDDSKGDVRINLKKWKNYFREIDKILDSYKISKYYIDLYNECREEGVKKFFSNISSKEIINDIDQTIFSIIEKMLTDFDELNAAEKNSLIKNIESSKAGTMILKKYGKLDKSSPQIQLKSLISNVDKLKPQEIKDLLNSIFRSKKRLKFMEEIKKLPRSMQSKLISSADRAAHLLSLYFELKKSLKEFKNIVKKHKSSQNKDEKAIHAFLAENYWLLGVEYFRQVIKTDINPKKERTGETYHKEWRIYPDFEIFKFNGSVDRCVVIELEEANDKIFNKNKSLSKEALDGLFQAITYTIFHSVEKNKPTKGIAILGSTGKLTRNQKQKLLRLSNLFPTIEIKTYEDIIEDAENMISFIENYEDEKKRKLVSTIEE